MTFRSGKFVIVAMFGVGLAAALFGMWFRYQSTRHALEFWGPMSVVLIVRAPQVTAIEFDPPVPDAVIAELAERHMRRSQDVSHARGILNVRQAFVEDSTFAWGEPTPHVAEWSHALRFSDGEQTATILFDAQFAAAGNPVTGDSVRLKPEASRDLTEFFGENFGGKEMPSRTGGR